MYYEPYEAKIRKIAHVRDVIYKFRFLIIGIFALIMGLIIAFLSVKGSIRKDVQIDSSYVYGESISPHATAFMSDVQYEYCENDAWTKEKPVMPGNYRVRAKTKNGFGKKRYGKEVAFRIEPAPLTVTLEREMTYGEKPQLSITGFVGGDRLDEEKLEFELGESFDAQSTITLEKSSFVIVDAKDQTVTRAYSVDDTLFEAQPVTVKPRRVVLVTGSAEKEYDGTALRNADYSFETALAFEDVASVKCLGEITKVGGVKNEATATFTDAKGRDVTKYYDVVPSYGELSVLPRAITVTVHSLPDKIYDGKPTENFPWELSSGTLADGETFSVNDHAYSSLQGEWTTALNVGEYALCMRELTIENGDGATTENYLVTTVDGSLCIKPREITLLIDDLPTKVYDGKGYGEISWRVATDTPLADGQIPSAESFAHATLNGQPALGRNVGVYTLTMGNFGVFDETIGEDVTGNYTWTERTGTYEVTKRPFTLELPNYGVNDYSSKSYSLEINPSGGLAEGEYLADYQICVTRDGVQIEHTGSVRDAGVYTFTFLDFPNAVKICRADDPTDDTTHNYELIKVDGGVTINRISLNVTVKNSEKLYDAKPFRLEDFTFEVTGLIENENYVPALTYKQTAIDAGQYNMKETLTFTDQVYRNDGTDSSMNYIYNVQTEETLVIRKRQITMQILDRVRPYDGTPLTCDEWYIPEDCEMDFLPDHTVELKTTGSITQPGKIENSKASVEVYEGGKSVTHNYELTVKDGSLEVTKRAVTLKPVFMTWEYDGKYFNPRADFAVPVTVAWTNDEDSGYGDPLYDGAKLKNAAATWQKDKYMDAALYVDALQVDQGSRIYEGDMDVTEKYFDVTYGKENLYITPRIIEIVMHDISYEEGNLVRSENDFHIAKGTLVTGHTITQFSFGDKNSNTNYLQSITISNDNGVVMCRLEFNSNGDATDVNSGNNNYQIVLKVGKLIMVETDKQQTTE